MRILFSSTRGTGHARPLLPYLQSFRGKGHEVVFAAPEQLREMIEKEGIPFAPLYRLPEEQIQESFKVLETVPKDDFFKYLIQNFWVRGSAENALPDLLKLAEEWKPDLIVRESGELAATLVSAKLAIPSVRVQVHNSPTEELFLDFAPEPLDELREEIGMSAGAGAFLNAERAFTSFPKSFDPMQDWSDRAEPFRVSTSAAVGPVTGARPDWAPDNGRPLVYVTFGTVAGNESKERDAYNTALKAMGSLPVNALLTTGSNMDRALLSDIPENVRVETWVPQADVFAYANAIVHHCGSGTLIGTLAAGLPSVAVPLFADQPSNGEQIERIGAGISVFDLNEDAVKSAVTRALDDESMAARAKEVAVEIAALPFVDDAVDEMLRV